jgi:hypothetical protein
MSPYELRLWNHPQAVHLRRLRGIIMRLPYQEALVRLGDLSLVTLVALSAAFMAYRLAPQTTG